MANDGPNTPNHKSSGVKPEPTSENKHKAGNKQTTPGDKEVSAGQPEPTSGHKHEADNEGATPNHKSSAVQPEPTSVIKPKAGPETTTPVRKPTSKPMFMNGTSVATPPSGAMKWRPIYWGPVIDLNYDALGAMSVPERTDFLFRKAAEFEMRPRLDEKSTVAVAINCHKVYAKFADSGMSPPKHPDITPATLQHAKMRFNILSEYHECLENVNVMTPKQAGELQRKHEPKKRMYGEKIREVAATSPAGNRDPYVTSIDLSPPRYRTEVGDKVSAQGDELRRRKNEEVTNKAKDARISASRDRFKEKQRREDADVFGTSAVNFENKADHLETSDAAQLRSTPRKTTTQIIVANERRDHKLQTRASRARKDDSA